jgi:hypothetical protein
MSFSQKQMFELTELVEIIAKRTRRLKEDSIDD